jgi:hypothetical protein
MATVPAKSKRQAIDEHAPWRPPKYEEVDVIAIQALARGTANLEQQKRALAWIIERAAGTYDMSYRPGAGEGDRDTVFAEGRRFVGNQVVKMTKLKIGQRRSEQ